MPFLGAPLPAGSGSAARSIPPPPSSPPLPSAPPPPAGGRSLPGRLIVVGVAGIAALVGLGWLGTTVLTGGATGPSHAIVAVEDGDVYLLDSVEAASAPARDDRVLRDAVVGGSTVVVDGGVVVSHGPFGYTYEGGPLFAYGEEGDDEWHLAIVDGREVVDLERFEGRPSTVYVTSSGTYVIEQRSSSCSIMRLVGRETERVTRSDFCMVNPVADVAIVAEQGSTRNEVSFVDLATEESTPILDADRTGSLSVAFSLTNRSVLVTGVSDGDRWESVLVDLGSGNIIAEADRVAGQVATDSGFFGYEFDTDDMSLVFVGPASTEELSSGPAFIDVALSPSGSRIVVREWDGIDVTLSSGSIDGTAVGALVEVDTFDGWAEVEFLDDDRLVVVTSDGVIGVVAGDRFEEIGELDEGDEFATPVATRLGERGVLVTNGTASGVVRASDSSLLVVDDLASAYTHTLSPDQRWLAVSGLERSDSTDQMLLLVDLENLDYAVVDEDTGFNAIQFSDGHLYFAVVGDDTETRRVSLSLDGRVEDVADDVLLYVPGEGTRLVGRLWDTPYLPLG
ncbi:MAG: hypothetical protein ACFCVK_25690 [Acidimicrobiales bacterium]